MLFKRNRQKLIRFFRFTADEKEIGSTEKQLKMNEQ